MSLMETIVIAILLASGISVAFLNKMTDLRVGRQDLQLVSRKEEGEMMVQGYTPTVSVYLCPKTSCMTKSTKFIGDAVFHVQDHSISLPATDAVMLNTLVIMCHRQIFIVKGGTEVA